MFIGRETELKDLKNLWRRSAASLVTVRGRRRIGKSTLIEEFARRNRVRFVKIEGVHPGAGVTNETQLENFARMLAAFVGTTMVAPILVSDYRSGRMETNTPLFRWICLGACLWGLVVPALGGNPIVVTVAAQMSDLGLRSCSRWRWRIRVRRH